MMVGLAAGALWVMGIHLDVVALRHELARRAITGAELAQAAGLSSATVSHALNGRPIAESTLRRLARALTTIPAVPGAEALLAAAPKAAAA
jgi:transcriptional regulator with XRE-family HTH domain